MNEDRINQIMAAIFACRSEDCPEPFALYRHQDVTGVSGEGTVAHGVQFTDGTVVIRWLGAKPSTVIWASMDDAMAVHGHDGKTQVVSLAAPFSEMRLAEEEAAATERERIARFVETDLAEEFGDAGTIAKMIRKAAVANTPAGGKENSNKDSGG